MTAIVQWTIADFERHRPVFRTTALKRGVLFVALYLITLTAVLDHLVNGVRSFVVQPILAVSISLILGAVMAATWTFFVDDILKRRHYDRLNYEHSALQRCRSLLSCALADEAVTQKWAAGKEDLAAFRFNAMTTTKVDDWHTVEDAEMVFELIDAWIQEERKREQRKIVDITERTISR